MNLSKTAVLSAMITASPACRVDTPDAVHSTAPATESTTHNPLFDTVRANVHAACGDDIQFMEKTVETVDRPDQWPTPEPAVLLTTGTHEQMQCVLNETTGNPCFWTSFNVSNDATGATSLYPGGRMGYFTQCLSQR